MLVRGRGAIVVADFHQGIAHHSPQARVVGRGFHEPLGILHNLAEVVAVQFDFVANDQRFGVARLAGEHLRNQLFGAFEVAEVGGLAHFLQIGRGKVV